MHYERDAANDGRVGMRMSAIGCHRRDIRRLPQVVCTDSVAISYKLAFHLL